MAEPVLQKPSREKRLQIGRQGKCRNAPSKPDPSRDPIHSQLNRAAVGLQFGSAFNGSADSSDVSAASSLVNPVLLGFMVPPDLSLRYPRDRRTVRLLNIRRSLPFLFGVISSIRAPSPISFSIASALTLSFVVSTVRQYGFSKTLTMYVVAGLSFIARPANLLCG
ncbi:hypothetical protein NKI48_29580 [Mesorhizobium sp. M0644]|uniref:hypothetical protein n=1 Tax=Mesorhizobium sp. M0644 TaxID=2956979 RepID=UPI0033392A95